jgi:hypothetical protein
MTLQQIMINWENLNRKLTSSDGALPLAGVAFLFLAYWQIRKENGIIYGFSVNPSEHPISFRIAVGTNVVIGMVLLTAGIIRIIFRL